MIVEKSEKIKKGLMACSLSSNSTISKCAICPYKNVPNCSENMNKDALAYIQLREHSFNDLSLRTSQLEDHIRNLPKMVPKWISVEDRLPEPDEEVLICARSNKTNVHTIAMTSYTLCKYGFNIEGWNEPWQYFNYDWVITYWMPLPDAPKETYISSCMSGCSTV